MWSTRRSPLSACNGRPDLSTAFGTSTVDEAKVPPRAFSLFSTSNVWDGKLPQSPLVALSNCFDPTCTPIWRRLWHNQSRDGRARRARRASHPGPSLADPITYNQTLMCHHNVPNRSRRLDCHRRSFLRLGMAHLRESPETAICIIIFSLSPSHLFGFRNALAPVRHTITRAASTPVKANVR